MDPHTQDIRRAWEDRQQHLGNNHRSVLFKNLPSWMNESLHRRHSNFILANLPQKMISMLDVGCGYGRLSREVQRCRHELEIYGVELCEAFAKQFEGEFSGCFHGSMQDYRADRQFDVVLLVTVLMYSNRSDLSEVLSRLWDALAVGGRLICIEPSNNFLVRWRRKADSERLRPTGGDVLYFRAGELRQLFEMLPGAHIAAQRHFGLLPGLLFPEIHHGIVVEKVDNE